MLVCVSSTLLCITQYVLFHFTSYDQVCVVTCYSAVDFGIIMQSMLLFN